MNYAQATRELYDLRFVAGMNQRCTQIVQGRWATADRFVRILMATLAFCAVLFGAFGGVWTQAGLGFSIAGCIVALVLNVGPFGRRERFWTDLYRRWSDLRSDVESLELKTKGVPAEDQVPDHIVERMQAFSQKRNGIEADEPKPSKRLLVRCHEDQTEEVWGKGIRTPDDVQAEQKRRKMRT